MSFGVKSIKQHGMQDSRWTVQNKITQYKGLIKLYERDAKILQYDRRITERKLKRECNQLKKDIFTQNQKLNNAIKQQNREILAKHRNLQLTFQEHPPTKTIDHLEYGNFKKRKELDRLNYQMKKKSKELIEYKLVLSKMEDFLIYASKPIPEQQIGEMISGKVKETQIRQEAALEIQHTYKKILNVLKKDRLYFDAVLNQLHLDCHNQSQFLYRVTEIGQLATEYTDDRKHEFIELERAVKRDMKSRISQIKVMEEQVQNIRFTLKKLIRRDSDINLLQKKQEPMDEDIKIQKDLDDLRSILTDIKEFTLTATFRDIFSCIQNQAYLTNMLSRKYKKKMKHKAKLLNKLNHAKNMHSQISLKNENTRFNYLHNKEILKTQIKDMNSKYNDKRKHLQICLENLEILRTSLMHLHNLCRMVRTSPESIRKDERVKIHLPHKDALIYAPPLVETDVSKILNDLELKFNNLLVGLSKYPALSATDTTDLDIEKFYQKFIQKTSCQVKSDTDLTYDVLVIDTMQRDPKVITREEIKKESQLLCEANAPPEWMK